jgi:hypothetical protein
MGFRRREEETEIWRDETAGIASGDAKDKGDVQKARLARFRLGSVALGASVAPLDRAAAGKPSDDPSRTGGDRG